MHVLERRLVDDVSPAILSARKACLSRVCLFLSVAFACSAPSAAQPVDIEDGAPGPCVSFSAAVHAEAPIPAEPPATLRAMQSGEMNDEGRFLLGLGLEPIGIPVEADALARNLDYPEAGIRYSIIRGLGRMGEARHVEALAALLKDPDRVIRDMAVRSLNQLLCRRPALRSPDIQRRLVLEARDLLRTAARDGERVEAAAVLARLGDPSGYPAVLQALKNRYDPAETVIPTFLHYDLKTDDGKPLDWVTPLRPFLQDPERSYVLKSGTILVLERIGTPAAQAALRDALATEADPQVLNLLKRKLHETTLPLPEVKPQARATN